MSTLFMPDAPEAGSVVIHKGRAGLRFDRGLRLGGAGLSIQAVLPQGERHAEGEDHPMPADAAQPAMAFPDSAPDPAPPTVAELVRATGCELEAALAGMDLLCVEPAQAADCGAPYLATVRSVRGPWNHSTVARHGQVIHDPSGRLDLYRSAPILGAEIVVASYDPDPDELIRHWAATS